MSPSGSVSAEELLRSLDRRAATLPAEIAAFIALSACESMIETGARELTSLAQVRISDSGAVVLSGAPSDDGPASRGLQRVLVSLLKASGKNLPPALQRMLERSEEDAPPLQVMHDQLEATLVPLNRTASRRVLSRFAREAAHPLIDPRDVDAALNSLLAEEKPANDAPRRERYRSLEPDATGSRLQVDLLEGLELENEETHFMEHALEHTVDVSAAPSQPPPKRSPSLRPSFAPAMHGAEPLRSHASQLEELGSPRNSRKLFIGFSLVALAVLGLIVAVSLRDQRAHEAQQRAAVAAAAAEERAEPILRPRGGDLRVHVSEPNAQVLRFVGTAPVSVDGLTVGEAHEFVATAEGHHPARVLVPANADWEATAGGARYELALQLPPNEPGQPDRPLELGPSRMTSPQGAAPTRRGSIRVVTSPRGARVYQLVGFSPDVSVQDVPLDGTQELLIYREGFAPVLRVLQESDFKDEDGRRVADLTVQLAKR